MVLIDPGLPFEDLVIERFDYFPAQGEWGDWAVLRLLAGLGTQPAAPSVAHLVIERAAAGECISVAAETHGVERRLRAGGPAGLEVLWSATFSVPLEAVQAPAAVFTLLAGDRQPVAVTLPAPVRHDAVINPILSLRERRPGRQRAIRPRQIAAVATSVAVTATSVPTVALATQVTTPTSTPAPAAASLTTSTPAATTTAATPAPATPTPPAPAATPAVAPPANADHTQHPAHHATSRKHLVVTSTRRRAKHAVPAPAASSRTSAGASGCATTDTARPIAYAADARTSTAAHAHTTCRIKVTPTPPGVGASISFGTTSAPKSSTATTSSSPSTTSGTAPSTPTATLQPGKPTPTPASHHAASPAHHAASPAHHAAARASSGGASLAPSTPRSSSTPPPTPSPDSSTSTGTVTGLSSTPPGFSGPQSWTGTVAANPALTGAVTELSGLLSNGDRPPSFLIPIYMEAGRRYHLPWEVLAAINAIETDYGRNLNTSSAGAVGWMQFEPSTWAQYGMAVDGHSVPNPYDPRDAIFSAARYLAAAGAAQDVSRAVFAYNHASWYVDEVMSRAQAISTHAQFEQSTVEHGKFAVYFAGGHRPGAGGRRAALQVRYTSGVLSHYDRLIAAANMVSAANFPYVWGGGHTQPSRFGPFDCSGSVSYVMQQAGYKVPTTVSGDIPTWKFPAGPGQVTIFYNPTHTFMRIGNRYFGTSGFARPGGGAGWFAVDRLPASYLAQFNEVHVPNLGPDSFDGSHGPLVVTPLFTQHRHRRTTSTLSVLPLMSTLGPFPGTASLPALPQ